VAYAAAPSAYDARRMLDQTGAKQLATPSRSRGLSDSLEPVEYAHSPTENRPADLAPNDCRSRQLQSQLAGETRPARYPSRGVPAPAANPPGGGRREAVLPDSQPPGEDVRDDAPDSNCAPEANLIAVTVASTGTLRRFTISGPRRPGLCPLHNLARGFVSTRAGVSMHDRPPR